MKEEKDDVLEFEDEEQSLYDVEPGENITLTDDQGTEVEFTVQGILDTEDGNWYIYLVAADEVGNDAAELLIYRLLDDGSDMEPLDDDEEYNKAFDEFMKEVENSAK